MHSRNATVLIDLMSCATPACFSTFFQSSYYCHLKIRNFLVYLFIYVYSVSCPSLTDPNDGMMTCSLGDVGVPSYEDTCSFTCNTGYELTGSNTRTCQSNGSWNNSGGVCRKSMYVYRGACRRIYLLPCY